MWDTFSNLAFGLALAWVPVRYDFPGRRLIDAAVDLPFALPTAVAGIALTTLYAPNGAFGQLLAPLGIKVAYTPLGIWVALVFVGGLVCWKGFERFRFLMTRAERVASLSTCGGCNSYAKFSVVDENARFRVRCRKCGSECTISGRDEEAAAAPESL